MTTQNETQHPALDKVKWVAVFVIVIAAIWANYHFSNVGVALRVGGVVIALAVAAALALWTGKGQEVLAFAKESRIEAKKVIWPTQVEARRTTLIIFVAVFVLALALWGFDAAIVRIVALITHMEF